MKALLHVCASLNTSYSPYSILDVPEGTGGDELRIIADQILPSLYGSEDTVAVDKDGVCWNNGECWYIEGLHFISEEDAEHLTRILGICTL
ncbi:hypothetical protein ACB381_18450 [Klebsiella michiganensis]|uniref:hypothetical protein n=1 Tax=Klebsiella/Raoultella group TaxID=2890311 RepID=UPI00064A180E|nr:MULTISPECIES: hypothetical protein [Klebsiella]AKL03880.1 hypothetical protein AB184_00980 [Klebsiella oxytoca]AKL20900.1 hypothetical protein AB181_01745 [Klebsiella oxytoca]APB48246.1 hypothetical protein AGF18_30215 [Klebsiella oxytoca]